jgi:acyl-CoA thioester hydrolase
MDGLVRQVVAYADTDAGGIMYHGRYIELAERSRLQWILDGDLSFDAIATQHDTLLVIHKLSSVHHAPARLENVLFARTELMQMGSAKARWRTTISHGSRLVATVTADVVAVSAVRKELARFPSTLVNTFSHRLGGVSFAPSLCNVLHN